MTLSILRKPSAFLPMAMSFAALAVLLTHIALYGMAKEADEGTAAHLFQLLIAAQLPVAAYFALRWLPEYPRQTVAVLAMQFCVAFVPLAVLYWSGL
jgi:hypothetical protein